MKLIFDIETVRQYKDLEDAPIEYSSRWVDFSKKRFPEIDPKESYIEKASLFPEFAKVVVISTISSESKELKSFTGMEFGGTNAEMTLLKNFQEKLNDEWSSAQLIGHYIKAFDIPFVVVRMAANGIKIPKVLKLYGTKPWELSIIDTYDVWKQGQFKSTQAASLDIACMVMGIESPKEEMSGGDVASVYFSEVENAIEQIKDYCERDVKANAALFNKMYKLGMI